ncbi:hypothetical protein FACS189429_7530 [Bacteroidia bacterium]|nr:hypothetical protein FACS189429_7530 [Bacteroidia bacterium]
MLMKKMNFFKIVLLSGVLIMCVQGARAASNWANTVVKINGVYYSLGTNDGWTLPNTPVAAGGLFINATLSGSNIELQEVWTGGAAWNDGLGDNWYADNSFKLMWRVYTTGETPTGWNYIDVDTEFHRSGDERGYKKVGLTQKLSSNLGNYTVELAVQKHTYWNGGSATYYKPGDGDYYDVDVLSSGYQASLTCIPWVGNSWLNINDAYYKGTQPIAANADFHGADLGTFSASTFRLWGGVQIYPKTPAATATMYWLFDGNASDVHSVADIGHTRNAGDYGNGNKTDGAFAVDDYPGEAHQHCALDNDDPNCEFDTVFNASISHLLPGTHTITVWFKVNGFGEVDDASFTANFVYKPEIKLDVDGDNSDAAVDKLYRNTSAITSAVGEWVLVTSPLKNSTKTDFTFGSSSAAFKDLQKPSGNHTKYWWSTVAGSNLAPGKGFAYQVNSAKAVSTNASWNTGIKTFTGRETNNGNFEVLQESGLKYALVGNPYYKDITLNHFEGTNLAQSGYYTTDADGETFPLVQGTSIHKWQGIILAANVGQALGDKITIKEHIATPAPVPALAHSAICLTAINTVGSSNTYINNNAGGSTQIGNADMSFLNMGENEVVQVYTSKNDAQGNAYQLALNTVNTDNATIPVGIFTTYAGAVTLTLTGMDSYDCGVALLDNLTGASTDLTGLSTYSYEITVSGNSVSRFAIVLSPRVPTDISANETVNTQTFASNGKIHIVSTDALQQVRVFSVSGAQIFNSAINGTSYIVNSQLPAGVYLVEVSTSKSVTTQKVVLK